MAFDCPSCGLRNSEVQSAEVQEKGCRFEVTVSGPRDLNRQVVKSDRCTVTLVELEFEIPPNTQKGVFTTIEGLLRTARDNLVETQPRRRALDPESADAVDAFCDRLTGCVDGAPGSLPFTLVLDDPTGNSFLENLDAPRADPAMRVKYYHRSGAQNRALGLYAESARAGPLAGVAEEGEEGEEEEEGGGKKARLGGAGFDTAPCDDAEADAAAAAADAAAGDGDSSALTGSAAHTGTLFPPRVVEMSGNTPSGFTKGGAHIRGVTARASASGAAKARAGPSGAGLVFDSSTSDAPKEVMRFAADCFACSAPGETRMCVTDVPHFKEVILMSFSCEACGWRDVEVKGGGAVPPHGSTTILRYDPTHPDAADDLGRDVIKGDTAAVELPELELALAPGSLGGMYTTVEGLLTAVRDKLLMSNPFGGGGGSGAKASVVAGAGGPLPADTPWDGTGVRGGDSSDATKANRYVAFLADLEACIEGTRPFTLILKDPMANTWVYSPVAPAPDPRLEHSPYVRSAEEDVELGLTDMLVEGYGEDKMEEEEGEGGA